MHTWSRMKKRKRISWWKTITVLSACLPICLAIANEAQSQTAASQPPAVSRDREMVGSLDEQFQAAVKANDAATMDKILAEDFVLVTGSGKVFNKAESLQEARSRSTIYEHQEDTERTVRVWGDTAVVTAKLWIKGVREGKPVDYTLWFSDTYVRGPEGWRYVFGQASLPLPKSP